MWRLAQPHDARSCAAALSDGRPRQAARARATGAGCTAALALHQMGQLEDATAGPEKFTWCAAHRQLY